MPEEKDKVDHGPEATESAKDVPPSRPGEYDAIADIAGALRQISIDVTPVPQAKMEDPVGGLEVRLEEADKLFNHFGINVESLMVDLGRFFDKSVDLDYVHRVEMSLLLLSIIANALYNLFINHENESYLLVETILDRSKLVMEFKNNSNSSMTSEDTDKVRQLVMITKIQAQEKSVEALELFKPTIGLI